MNFNLNSNNGNIVTEDDIKKSDNAIVYEPPEINSDSANFPDVPDLLGEIGEILEYMCEDDVITLRNKSAEEFNKHMEEKFPVFSDRYYAVFQKLLSGEDLTPLFSMLGAIEKIKSGQVSLEDAEKNLGLELADKYIHKK